MSDGTTMEINGEVAWSINGPAIATIGEGGMVTAQQYGSTTVVAQSNGFSASASLTVASVSTLNVYPATLSIAPGASRQFFATATLSDGKTEDVTATVSWSSTQPSVAAVGGLGLVTAAQLGSTTIVAQGNGASGSATVNVLPPVALNIVPATVTTVIGSVSQLQAIATLSDGTTENVTTLSSWSSTQPNIAGVSSTGGLDAEQVGSTTIVAQFQGQSASASVTVIPLLLLHYFNRANAVASGIDSEVLLANPGVTRTASNSGSLCAMIYVFDQNQELNECCGCSISDSGLLTLSLVNDLTANPLTGTSPTAGSIMVVPSDIGSNPQCNAASLTPTGALAGSETNDQDDGDGTFQVTESSFASAPLNSVVESSFAELCSFIETMGSGSGICSCGSGEGSVRKKSSQRFRTELKH